MTEFRKGDLVGYSPVPNQCFGIVVRKADERNHIVNWIRFSNTHFLGTRPSSTSSLELIARAENE